MFHESSLSNQCLLATRNSVLATRYFSAIPVRLLWKIWSATLLHLLPSVTARNNCKYQRGFCVFRELPVPHVHTSHQIARFSSYCTILL